MYIRAIIHYFEFYSYILGKYANTQLVFGLVYFDDSLLLSKHPLSNEVWESNFQIIMISSMIHFFLIINMKHRIIFQPILKGRLGCFFWAVVYMQISINHWWFRYIYIIYIYIYVCIYIYIIGMCVWMCVYMCVYLCVYVSLYLYLYVCIYRYVYKCIIYNIYNWCLSSYYIERERQREREIKERNKEIIKKKTKQRQER